MRSPCDGFWIRIVGCGMISNFHAKAIAIRGAKLVACYDTVTAAAIGGFPDGLPSLYRTRQMLADKDVQIVTIGTPSGAHFEPAVAAAEREST